tara:strand:+ start:1219 stop:1980 length:762 start_codon:yes stop_codon:yes gene_type:complete
MNKLAEKLADAWIKKDLIDINSEEFPKSRKDSHLIQKQFHQVLNRKTVGWKIGMVTKNLQDGAKVDGPMIGKIIEETVLMDPLKIDYNKVPHCILECEFALKFLEDTQMLPGAENKKDNYEIFISLELVSTRIKPDYKKNLDSRNLMFLNVADNGGAGAIVIGNKIQNPKDINLNSIEVEVDLNGKITGAWEKRAHPTEAIKCIINEFKDNPVTFKKGDWFMTGSIIQPMKINKGDKIKVNFKTLGKINLDFI